MRVGMHPLVEPGHDNTNRTSALEHGCPICIDYCPPKDVQLETSLLGIPYYLISCIILLSWPEEK
jgi:hypothetical protein